VTPPKLPKLELSAKFKLMWWNGRGIPHGSNATLPRPSIEYILAQKFCISQGVMLGFWVGKDKQKRRGFLMPDIARITPYSIEECVERLNQYVSKQPRHSNTEFISSQDKYDPDVWHFILWKTFFDTQYAGRNTGTARLQMNGILMKWKSGDFTKVRAVVKDSPSFYFLWIGFAVIFAVILAIARNLPANIYFLLILMSIAFAAFFIYQGLVSMRQSKREFLDEIKEVLHKEDGSIE
jgi:hypothetical protein